MHNIESYSRYINELIKEGKYENVLINFSENSNNFPKKAISTNKFLVKNLLKAFKEVSKPLEGLQFLNEFEIDIHEFNDQYVTNSYGWLLFSILKNSSLFSPEDIEMVLDQSTDLLIRINILEEHFNLLVKQLMSKIIQVEKRHSSVSIDRTLRLLKGLNINTNSDVKNFVKSEPYISSGIIDLFRKSGHVERAFGFIKFLSLEINHETSEQVLNAYGWCLYSKLKQELNEIDDEPEVAYDSLLVELMDDSVFHNFTTPSSFKEELLLSISNCISLFSTTSDYSPFSKLYNLSLKAQKTKSNPNWRWIIDFLTAIDAEKLSNNSETVEFEKNGKTKKVELASDLENWYSYYSLAQIKLGNFQECLEISKQALFRIEKFHYNNDLWFARKIALSNKGLGNVEEAIQSLILIEKRKPEWFIQKEISELYFESDDLTNAKKFAIKSALSFGDMEKKDGLYFLLAKIFTKEGNKDLAYVHLMLSKLIREEQEWSIPPALKSALESSFGPNIKFETSKLAFQEAMKSWRILSTANGNGTNNWQKKTGIIIRIHPIKEIGTIRCDVEDKNYFFRFNDFQSSKDRIAKGINVEFKGKPPKELSKDWIAFDIKIKQV